MNIETRFFIYYDRGKHHSYGDK